MAQTKDSSNESYSVDTAETSPSSSRASTSYRKMRSSRSTASFTSAPGLDGHAAPPLRRTLKKTPKPLGRGVSRARSMNNSDHGSCGGNSSGVSSSSSRKQKDKVKGVPGRARSGDHLVLAAMLKKQATQTYAAVPNEYTPTGLDRNTLLDRLNRLKNHLPQSLIEQLLTQIEREQQNQPKELLQRSNDMLQKSNTAAGPRTRRLEEIQAQIMALEERADRQATNLALFEFELNDSKGSLGYEDDEASEISDEDDDDDDDSHQGSSDSYSSYDVMPLGGQSGEDSTPGLLQMYLEKKIFGDDPREQQQQQQQQQQHQGPNGDAKSVSSSKSRQDEQLVTKIGRTRMNRALRKSPCPSVSGDASSVTEASYEPGQILATPAVASANERKYTSVHAGSVPHLQMQHSLSSVATPEFLREQRQQERLLLDARQSAICLVDISGFTNLSRALDVEDLSMTINNYFQMIVDNIQEYGGDVLKFVGDALIVEWREVKRGRKRVSPWQAVLNAASCASRIVDECSDLPVYDEGKLISTLNVHCGLGYGHVTAFSVGDDNRREFLVIGETIRQVAETMHHAKQGEVVASAEAYSLLNEAAWVVNPAVFDDDGDRPQVVASKKEQYFKAKVESGPVKQVRDDDSLTKRCESWHIPALEHLLARMSSYVHPAVLLTNDHPHPVDASTMNRRSSISTNASSASSRPGSASSSTGKTNKMTNNKVAELREVFTAFIQPQVNPAKIMGNHVELETVELLNQLMLIVNSEVTRFKGHVRQFCVDDKGLVIICNFGLRGSTFPNMVQERGLPCISNIRTLIKTELELNCRIGATFGKAYCGIVGASDRFEYSILGAPVNLAARLMASTQNPGILVDEAVMLKAAHHPFESLEPVTAKGYDKPVKIFKPRESIRKSWKGLSSHFIGRNHEMGIVANSAKTILKTKRHSEMLFFTGPYGSGKSLLLSHAINRVERACSMSLKTFYASKHVFCEEDSFKPFSILRPLFLGLMRGKQTVNITAGRRMSNNGMSSRRSSRREGSSGGSIANGSAHTGASGFSLAGSDSVVSQSTAGGTDVYFHDDDESVSSVFIDEKMLNLELLKICLGANIPMNYVEVFGGLIFTNKLSDIGSWADRGQKQSEWDQIAKYVVKAYVHVTQKYDMAVLALDEVNGMDEMSWKILELLYHESRNTLVLCAARSSYDLNVPDDFWQELTTPDCGYFTLHEMPPLEPNETNKLFYSKLGKRRPSVPEEDAIQIARTVHCLSAGNPLLASEIVNKLYLNFTPQEEEELENLGYIGELLMNRLDSLNASVVTYLNLGALLGYSFFLDDVVAIMAQYLNTPEDGWEAHLEAVQKALEVGVDNGILMTSPTESSLYAFVERGSGGRPFDLDEVVDERMRTFGLDVDERESQYDVVWSVLEDRVRRGVLVKETIVRTTYTFSHKFWQKSLSWRTLDGWKNEMLSIKAELDRLKREERQGLVS